MTQLQMELLLRVAMHYASPELRARLQAEVPEAYEAYWRQRIGESHAAVAEHDRIRAERTA